MSGAAIRKSRISGLPREIQNLEWYHPEINRHVAESLLLQNGTDGSYLLRPSSKENDMALSVRGKDSVRHFTVTYDGESLHLGQASFSTMVELIKHMDNQPLLGGDTGVLSMLKFPYPRTVAEPKAYEEVRIHAELGPRMSSKSQPSYSLNSKEGYLTKQGGFRKNWKTRWFTLVKNELKYFRERTDKVAIRIIDLTECTACAREVEMGKDNCFKLVLPWRTFYLYAATSEELEEWMYLIQWRLKEMNKSDGILREESH